MTTQAVRASPEEPPPALAPPAGNPRFPLVDSMRAIAALSVVAVHVAIFTAITAHSDVAAPLIHLNVGVTIFFLVSGFLLYRPYVAARHSGAPTPRLATYARRRVLRIVPAYWVALTLLALVFGLPGVFSQDWWAYYGFLQIYPVAYDPQMCTAGELCGLAQAWSLAVEVSFYVTLPLLAAGLGWVADRGGPRWVRRELAALGLLAVASVAFQLWSTNAFYPEHPSWFSSSDSLAGTFLWFALGMGAAVMSVADEHRDRSPWLVRQASARPGLIWAAAVALFLALSYLVLPPTVLKPSMSAGEQLAQHVGFGLVALLLLSPAVFAGDGPGLPQRILARPILAWLGLISYGIFLWHFTILRELLQGGAEGWLPGSPFVGVLLATAALAVVAGAASYYVVERPFLRLKYARRRDRRG